MMEAWHAVGQRSWSILAFLPCTCMQVAWHCIACMWLVRDGRKGAWSSHQQQQRRARQNTGRSISATMRASAVIARDNVGHDRSVEVMHITGHHGGVEQLHDRPGLIRIAECVRKQLHAVVLGETKDDMAEQSLFVLDMITPRCHLCSCMSKRLLFLCMYDGLLVT
jgi:hypothetical protein